MKLRQFRRYWLKRILKTQEDRNVIKRTIRAIGFKPTVHNQLAMHVQDYEKLR